MNADEKQILLQAQQFIQQRKFAEARFYLTQIQDNATAKKWLAKLNTIAPNENIPKTDNRVSSLLEDGLQIPQSTLDDSDKVLRPWNPDNFYMAILFFMPGALVLYSWNWKRFGKGEWGLETFLIGVLAIITGIVAIILSMTIDALDHPAFLGFSVAIVFSTHVWIFVTAWAQRKAYRAWLPTRNPEILRKYNHNPGQILLVWAGVSTLLAIGFAGVTAYTSRTVTYEDEALLLSYPGFWSSEAVSDSYFCETNYAGCFLYITRGSTLLNFSSYPIDYVVTPRQFVLNFWEQYREDNPGIDMTVIDESDLPGAHMMQYEFWYPDDEGGTIYGWWIFLYPPDTDVIYGIHAWAYSQDSMDNMRDDILEITNSIEFKSSITF
ncbi:MAG TPA: hypothetical protein VJZ27_01680 [Aggregatilineales bacterium]|nr:hypothetical protein [Aggregatilineales bacterium]